jgi:leucyl aminopeptidase (aminopeptidase T)
MQELMLLKDAAAIKALAHPLRLHLLEQLIAAPASVQQLAEQMNEVHAKLFYHVKELEKNGLVEVVGEKIVNGIVERFYRATARTFYLGQAVGKLVPGEQTVADAVQFDLLRQHRQQELQIDNRSVARNLVRNSLQLQPGAKVVLEGASYQFELLDAMLLECRLVGAEAFIRLMNSWQLRQMLEEMSIEQLAQAPPLTTLLSGQSDYWVSFDTIADASIFADCDPAKVDALVEGDLQAYRLGPKRFAAVEIGYPTPEHATSLGVDYGVLHDLFWQAISVDSAELRNLGETLADQLSSKPCVKLASEHGTQLEFCLSKAQEIVINDGVLDQSKVSATQLVDLTLPGGQVLLVPEPGTLTGCLAIDQRLLRGVCVRHIRLHFVAGQLAAWEAGTGKAELDALFTQLENPLRVTQLSLGLNPAVNRMTGYKLLDPVVPNTLGVQLGSTSTGANSDFAIPYWYYSKEIAIV